MKPETQRIAIAEACGLAVQTIPFVPAKCDATGWFSPSAAAEFYRAYPRASRVNMIPDYLHDLNAMHEAEKAIETENQFTEYIGRLIAITGDAIPIAATAAQRAEAFLRTIGKWRQVK